MLELKDMIEGEYYYVKDTTNEHIYIYNKYKDDFDRITSKKYAINLTSCDSYLHSDGFLSYPNDILQVRLATYQERQHLDQCIKANKYVDYVGEKEQLIKNII